MKPPERPKVEFEKVVVGEFLTGTIAKIDYDLEHRFSYKGQEKISPAVRFVFELDGYSYPKYSRWMYFSYGEKTNLYRKYLVKLVDGAKPDMDFDLDALVGMRVKTIWAEQNGFQYVELIQPEGKKISADATPEEIPEIDLGDIPDIPDAEEGQVL